jgi:hypothetical protein
MDRLLIAPMMDQIFRAGMASPCKDELPAAPVAKGMQPQQMAASPRTVPRRSGLGFEAVLFSATSFGCRVSNHPCDAAPALGGLAGAVGVLRAGVLGTGRKIAR